MIVLILGLVLFLGAHSTRILAPGWRAGTIARIGDKRWRGVYTLVSLIGLVLIIWGYGLTRLDPIIVWSPPVWTRHLALLLMVPVFVLFAAANLPGRIRAAVQHPMLAGTKIWAFAHLIANGTLADILLFGSFLAWAVADRISVGRRPREAPAHGADRPPSMRNDVIAVVSGLALYLAFLLFLHRWLIGVSPL